MPSPTPCGAGGDLWVDGETGEGGADLGADEALSAHPRLYQVANIWTSKHYLLQYEILVDDHINVYLSNFRAQIISKKISVRFFENQKYHELKLKFYGYMIEVLPLWKIFWLQKIFSFQLGQHEHDYLGICKHYRSVQDTDSVREVNWRMIGKLWEKKLVPWL